MAWQMTQTRELKLAKWTRPKFTTETTQTRQFGPFKCVLTTIIDSAHTTKWHVGWYVGTTCLVYALFETEAQALEESTAILQAFLIQAQGVLDATGEVA